MQIIGLVYTNYLANSNSENCHILMQIVGASIHKLSSSVYNDCSKSAPNFGFHFTDLVCSMSIVTCHQILASILWT